MKNILKSCSVILVVMYFQIFEAECQSLKEELDEWVFNLIFFSSSSFMEDIQPRFQTFHGIQMNHGSSALYQKTTLCKFGKWYSLSLSDLLSLNGSTFYLYLSPDCCITTHEYFMCITLMNCQWLRDKIVSSFCMNLI